MCGISQYRVCTVPLNAGLWSRSRRLGLETYQRLGLVLRKIVNVSVSEGRRLGLGHLRLVPKTNFRPNYAGHINKTSQFEQSVNGL